MPAGHGLRSRTRDSFSRAFRKKGTIHLSTYLRTYHIGDYVDIKVNGAIHKGMPHKFYHGRTGQVWNVTKRAIGVEINKQVPYFFNLYILFCMYAFHFVMLFLILGYKVYVVCLVKLNAGIVWNWKQLGFTFLHVWIAVVIVLWYQLNLDGTLKSFCSSHYGSGYRLGLSLRCSVSNYHDQTSWSKMLA